MSNKVLEILINRRLCGVFAKRFLGNSKTQHSIKALGLGSLILSLNQGLWLRCWVTLRSTQPTVKDEPGSRFNLQGLIQLHQELREVLHVSC
jgi:hypothetical protein